MKILILGAAGFIGTNLANTLSIKKHDLTLVDCKIDFFIDKFINNEKIEIIESNFGLDTNFNELVKDQDMVIHLVSTTVPTTSNQHIAEELMANVVTTSKLLDSCVEEGIKKIVFISSGGTVYGKATTFPIKETAPTNPINSYGIQKITIEKLLFLYKNMYGLEYKVIRLSNPYGPFQRPNGILGVVTNFIYKAISEGEVTIFGDGTVIRDFIYIDDAVSGIINIALNQSQYNIYNLGCGYGTSINALIEKIESALNLEITKNYKPNRPVDVSKNYLSIERYEKEFGKLNPKPLEVGIKKTAMFLQSEIGVIN